MHRAIVLLIIGAVIVTLGAMAIIVSVCRRRTDERFLLWFGLFSILYGIVLVVRNDVFRLGFGEPHGIGISIERLVTLSVIAPGLLLFEDFYGSGWRSSIRWLLGIYCALAVVAMIAASSLGHAELILSPGTVLVIMVPITLAVGHLGGYRPTPPQNGRVLFAGLVAFYCAFALDHLLQAMSGHYRAQFEPYGFLVLALCLWFAIAQRVMADERQLVSLTDEMRAARTIQEAILPKEVPFLKNMRIAVRYVPMTAVAGDLYVFSAVPPNCLGILVPDVIGHGVPAALVASMVKVAISTQVERDCEPASVIAGLNGTLCREAHQQYVTAVYLFLDAAKRIGRYSVAAHPPPLLWRSGSQVLETLGGAGLLLGVRSDEAYAESVFSFEPGDRILVYTDGLTEAENAAEESFGDAALPAFIQKRKDLDGEQFLDLLLKEVLDWSRKGSQLQQKDDITVLVIDICDGGNPRCMNALLAR